MHSYYYYIISNFENKLAILTQTEDNYITVDGFIYMGTNFSWIELKLHIHGSKIHGNNISLHNSYENCCFLGTQIHGFDPPQKAQNWYPMKIKPFTVFQKI